MRLSCKLILESVTLGCMVASTILLMFIFTGTMLYDFVVLMEPNLTIRTVEWFLTIYGSVSGVVYVIRWGTTNRKRVEK